MLEYDDSAFHYFFITVLGCYLVPASLTTVWTLADNALGCSKSSDENKKANPNEAKKKSGLSMCFIFHTLVIIALWGLVFYLASSLSENAEIAQFDPYQILEIDSGSEISVIKKAYRKLSLQYHPDKNPGDAFAKDMFVKISKAHDVLTDDDARENYEKYGNPDGRQAMQVSIGLPTFLLEKDFHATILIVYLIVLAVVIPVAVGMWWSYSQQYGNNQVMKGTYTTYMRFITENINIKGLPEALGGSQEYMKLRYTDTDVEILSRSFKRMTGARKMAKPRHYKGKIIGAGGGLGTTLFGNNVLLHLHVLQEKIPTLNLQNNLDVMLLKMPKLVETMVFMTTFCARRFWLPQTMQIIKFSQFLTQGLWIDDKEGFLQLPHFTKKEASHAKKGNKGIKGIRDFIALPQDQRKGLKNLSAAAKAEVEEVCRQISNFKVTLKATVADEEEIATNDLVTLTVEITRLNVSEGELAKPVYAPRYPETKYEQVWILIAQPGKNRRLASAPKRLTAQTRTLTADLQFRAPPKPGSYTYDVYVMSDSYVGVDMMEKVTIDVISEELLPEYEVHPDDEDLEGPMALFTDQTENEFFEDSDTDSDEDAEDGMTDAQRKRRRERLKRKSDQKKDTNDDVEEKVDQKEADGDVDSEEDNGDE